MSWTREQALVVDADPQTRAAAVGILSAEGYECRESEEIGAATDYLRAMESGLVLTELELPGGSGVVGRGPAASSGSGSPDGQRQP